MSIHSHVSADVHVVNMPRVHVNLIFQDSEGWERVMLVALGPFCRLCLLGFATHKFPSSHL